MSKSAVAAKPNSKKAEGRVKHIAFTMYPVKDMARARRFYEDDLGLELTKNFRDQWIEYHLDNGCFSITTLATDVSPSSNSGGSIGFEVDDVDAAIAKLRAKSVRIKIEPFDTGVCRMAVVLDPEGNALTIHQKTR